MSRHSTASQSLSGGIPIDSRRAKAKPKVHAFQKAKFQIGSCRGDRIHYPADQSVFHVSDIPPAAMQAKIDVIQSKKTDILGIRPPGWNNTTTRRLPPREFNKSNQQNANDPPLGGMGEKILCLLSDG